MRDDRRMGVRRNIAVSASRKLGPNIASGYVRTVLDHAIDGIGPLQSAASMGKLRMRCTITIACYQSSSQEPY